MIKSQIKSSKIQTFAISEKGVINARCFKRLIEPNLWIRDTCKLNAALRQC